MDYREFVTRVQEKARLQTYEDAAEATEEVIRSLAQILPRQRAMDLCCDLPPEIVAALSRGPDAPDCLIDRQVFLGWLMNRADTTGQIDQTLGGYDSAPDDASVEVERRITAVLSVFKSQLSRDQQRRFSALLPHEVRHWFRSA